MKKKERFRWNPFAIFGESPNQVRFKAEVDDLEFASKEDLEAIKSDPKLSKVYNAMMAGVNKKFQDFSTDKKRLQQTIETLQNQVGELDGGLQEWENMYLTRKDAIDALFRGTSDTDDQKRVRGGSEDGRVWEKKFNQLVQAINQAGANFERELRQTQNQLRLSLQLNELHRKYPEMDAEKVLDAALKAGELDLDRIYHDVYKEDIFNKEIETRMKPKVEEELQKRMTRVETGSGQTPIKLELPKEASKSWTDLSQDYLKERAEEVAKGEQP